MPTFATQEKPVNRLAVVPALLFLTGMALPARAQEWTEVRSENGILVLKQADESRVLPVLRGTTEIQGTPDQVLAWIRDVSTHTRWQARCVEARLLEERDDQVFAYNRVGAPWPVSDRDSVLKSRLVSEDGGHRIEFESTDEKNVPKQSSVVRMAYLIGHWDLRPNGSGGTSVEYQIDSDPAGSLPGWLVAQVASDVPYLTLLNLKALVESGAER